MEAILFIIGVYLFVDLFTWLLFQGKEHLHTIYIKAIGETFSAAIAGSKSKREK